MPRSVLNATVRPAADVEPHEHAVPAHTHAHGHDGDGGGTRLASGGYLEIHGTSTSWRLKVTAQGRLAVQKEETHGVWSTHVVVH